MRRLNNEQGTLIVGLIIALVVLSVLIIVGYRVRQSKQDLPNKQLESTLQKDKESLSKGKNEYTSNALRFSFVYPKDWKLEQGPMGEGGLEVIVLTSPDHKRDESNSSYRLIRGTQISLGVVQTNYADTESYKSSLTGDAGSNYTNLVATEAAGIKTYQSDCGHPPIGSCVWFVKSKALYEFRNIRKETHSKEFEEMVKSFKFF